MFILKSYTPLFCGHRLLVRLVGSYHINQLPKCYIYYYFGEFFFCANFSGYITEEVDVKLNEARLGQEICGHLHLQ